MLHSVLLGLSMLEDGTDFVYRNVGNDIPTYAA
jgi:hypothetical protein